VVSLPDVARKAALHSILVLSRAHTSAITIESRPCASLASGEAVSCEGGQTRYGAANSGRMDVTVCSSGARMIVMLLPCLLK